MKGSSRYLKNTESSIQGLYEGWIRLHNKSQPQPTTCPFHMGGYHNTDKKISSSLPNPDTITPPTPSSPKYISKKSYCELSKSLDNMDARTGRSDMTAVVITAFELSEIC